jgi:hypothetical protein
MAAGFVNVCAYGAVARRLPGATPEGDGATHHEAWVGLLRCTSDPLEPAIGGYPEPADCGGKKIPVSVFPQAVALQRQHRRVDNGADSALRVGKACPRESGDCVRAVTHAKHGRQAILPNLLPLASLDHLVGARDQRRRHVEARALAAKTRHDLAQRIAALATAGE